LDTQNPTARHFISDEITQALLRACLPYDHPIRAELEKGAEITGVRDVAVSCNGVSLDRRIVELRHDPSHAASFPKPATTVSRTDMSELTKHFEQIANGTAAVE